MQDTKDKFRKKTVVRIFAKIITMTMMDPLTDKGWSTDGAGGLSHLHSWCHICPRLAECRRTENIAGAARRTGGCEQLGSKQKLRPCSWTWHSLEQSVGRSTCQVIKQRIISRYPRITAIKSKTWKKGFFSWIQTEISLHPLVRQKITFTACGSCLQGQPGWYSFPPPPPDLLESF